MWTPRLVAAAAVSLGLAPVAALTPAVALAPSAAAVGAVAAAVVAPATVDFGSARIAYPVLRDVVIGVAGGSPVTFQPAVVTPDPALPDLSFVDDFAVVDDGCRGVTLRAGATCTVRVRGAASNEPVNVPHETAVLSIASTDSLSPTQVGLSIIGIGVLEGTFLQKQPTRLWDTRSRGSRAPVPRGGDLVVPVRGASAAPDGATAVVLNVTAMRATAAGYLVAYPTGGTRPTTSFLNVRAGWTGAAMVTVPIGADGSVTIHNSSGATHLAVDLLGFYNGPGTGTATQYTPQATPQRIFDGMVPARAVTLVPWHISPPRDIEGDPTVKSMLVNLTVVSAKGAGYLATLKYSGGPLPATSVVNFAAGETSANLTIAMTADAQDSPFGFHVYSSSTQPVRLIVDVLGDYRVAPTGLRYRALTPTRIVNTRGGVGLAGAFTARQTRTASVPASLLTPDSRGVVGTLTAVGPTSATYLAQWRSGPRPGISTLNAVSGVTRANGAVVPLAGPPTFLTYNDAGTTDVIMDVTGTLEQYPPAAVLAAGR